MHTHIQNTQQVAAVLRDISEGTSYQTVRLVFRPYTHLPSSSCTSERLEASNELSSIFTSNKYSSLSFGSHNQISPLSTPYSIMISLVRVPRRVRYPSPYTIHIFILHHIIFHISIALLLPYRSFIRI